MRGPQENKNDKDNDKKLKKKQDDFRTGSLRERSRRDWGDNHGFRRDRRDKSGRVIKGRGKFVSIKHYIIILSYLVFFIFFIFVQYLKCMF